MFNKKELATIYNLFLQVSAKSPDEARLKADIMEKCEAALRPSDEAVEGVGAISTTKKEKTDE